MKVLTPPNIRYFRRDITVQYLRRMSPFPSRKCALSYTCTANNDTYIQEIHAMFPLNTLLTLRQGWRFLVENGGMNNFPKITLGYFWSPNTQFILNCATFGAQAGIFDTERFVYLCMIVRTELKACWNWQLPKKLGLQGRSSKIITETIRNARNWKLLPYKPP